MRCRLVVSALAVLLLVCGDGCSGTQQQALTDAEDVHVILIQACDKVVDGLDPNNRKTRVPQTHRATWVNQTDNDVRLSFGNTKRLFGSAELVVKARKSASLPVLADADLGEHEYTPDCPGATQPGPVIIVDPPPPGP
jgi:hypothetical protein